jgi:hypothetical protein
MGSTFEHTSDHIEFTPDVGLSMLFYTLELGDMGLADTPVDDCLRVLAETYGLDQCSYDAETDTFELDFENTGWHDTQFCALFDPKGKLAELLQPNCYLYGSIDDAVILLTLMGDLTPNPAAMVDWAVAMTTDTRAKQELVPHIESMNFAFRELGIHTGATRLGLAAFTLGDQVHAKYPTCDESPEGEQRDVAIGGLGVVTAVVPCNPGNPQRWLYHVTYGNGCWVIYDEMDWRANLTRLLGRA